MSAAVAAVPAANEAGVLRALDGVPLDMHTVEPAAAPRSHVVVVHGLGEHSRALAYPPFYDLLARHGCAVHAFDLRGHGRSGGPPVYARDWPTLRNDLAMVVARASRAAAGAPLFVVGGSLGGLIALDHAIEYPERLSGVVAAAPALDASGASPLLRRILPLLARVVPRLQVNPGLDLAGIAHDRAVVQAYASAPGMRLEKMTPGLAAAILRGIEHVHASAARLTVPALLLHGTDDPIVPIDGTRAFFERSGGADQEFDAIPGALHDLLLDRCGADVSRRIAAWLAARSLPVSAAAPR